MTICYNPTNWNSLKTILILSGNIIVCLYHKTFNQYLTPLASQRLLEVLMLSIYYELLVTLFCLLATSFFRSVLLFESSGTPSASEMSAWVSYSFSSFWTVYFSLLQLCMLPFGLFTFIFVTYFFVTVIYMYKNYNLIEIFIFKAWPFFHNVIWFYLLYSLSTITHN